MTSPAKPAKSIDELLAEDMARFYDDPLGFVMYAYPWDSYAPIQLVPLQSPYKERFNSRCGPDVWACEFLDELGMEIRKRGFDGVHAVEPIQMAVASGHGIGKSAISSWLVHFIMSTRPFCRGTVTANTYNQLEGKTWSQIASWTKIGINAHWFRVGTGKGSMKFYKIGSPESWFCKGETSDENNSESFAGQHAANSTSFYLFDEASAIPNKVWEVADGGLTDGEPMFFAFGNPTRNSGEFHRCFHRMKHRWITRQIDSRTAYLTNKEKIQGMVDDFGLDSDRVKVRVRGMFPSMSVKQFIATATVDAAFGKELKPEQYNFAPKILTCDPAWEGDDDLVIGLRQGLRFQILKVIPKNSNDIEIANLLARLEDEHEADAVFIDGGYGTGIYSAGQTLGRDWMLVWFGSASSDPGCLNKRAEMWNEMAKWLKEGGAIPNDQELYSDLTEIEALPRMDGKIQLESKADMKKRGLSSPGRGDALALSFAYPVAKKRPRLPGTGNNPRREYDPYSNLN